MQKPAETSAAGRKVSLQWQEAHKKLRIADHIPETAPEWSSGKRLLGVSPGRTMDLVNLSFQSTSLRRADLTASQIEADLIVDVSQSAGRRPWTSAGGVLRCLSTSSTLFSFRKRRTLTGLEHLALLGFVGVNGNGLTQSQLRNLAGEAMSLPQIAFVEAALLAAAPGFFGPL